MVEMFKIGLYFLFTSICFSCNGQVPNRIKKKFNYCYDSKINYSQTKINFNGYYIIKHNPYIISFHDMQGNRKERSQDTTFNTIVFFKDGIFTLGNTKSHRDYYDMEYLKRVEQKIQSEYEQFYNWQYWGIYKIVGDTIKMQYISHQPRFNPYWTLIEVWYVMINEKTLKTVYAMDYTHDNKAEFKENIVTIEFIETSLHLKSDTWLKREKWFWCDEKQYKQWKQKQKK
ncbi:MAG TPA: hypothetical protein PKX92_14195 [Edaphocola sp.]|nr:hypothetical protein [Edaphocola sp.]